MKKKSFQKKLQLSKNVVSNLSKAKGGADWQTYPSDWNPDSHYTYCPKCNP